VSGRPHKGCDLSDQLIIFVLERAVMFSGLTDANLMDLA